MRDGAGATDGGLVAPVLVERAQDGLHVYALVRVKGRVLGSDGGLLDHLGHLVNADQRAPTVVRVKELE